MSRGGEARPAKLSPDTLFDRCDQAFRTAESLLDGERFAEALRVLRNGEAELRLLSSVVRGDSGGKDGSRSVLSAPAERTVAARQPAGYARIGSETARLTALTDHAGRLLFRCTEMRDRITEELRRLHAGRGYQHGSTGIGAWFSEEA